MSVSSFSSAAKPGVCLSTDRPDSPFDGQVIYETDTNRTLVYDNSAWVVIHDPSLMSYSGTGVTVTADAATVSGGLTVSGATALSTATLGGENVTPHTGRKNYIYNGAMQVHQRTGTVTTSSGYTLDRWRIEPVNTGYTAGINGSVTQVDDSGYAMSVQSSTTAPGFYMIEQRLEGKDVAHLAGRTVTFSFKVKRVDTGITSGTIRVNHDDDLSGSLRDETTVATVESNVSTISTSAYEQYSTTFTFPATVSTTGYYRIGIYFHGLNGAGTSTELFRIKDVQLEEGNKATPFEHRSYGEELALCQRYYERVNYGNNNVVLGMGLFYQTTLLVCELTWKTLKRADPTVTLPPVANSEVLINQATRAVSSVTVSPSKPTSATVNVTTTTAHTAGYPGIYRMDGSSYSIEAEL